jgi:hypothetical protein
LQRRWIIWILKGEETNARLGRAIQFLRSLSGPRRLYDGLCRDGADSGDLLEILPIRANRSFGRSKFLKEAAIECDTDESAEMEG